ncbi:hypothetical protein JVT61DRAFT_6023 [Boletus reticuloceps]|uniref:Uncharacterized protein n=1 Tax=Boletus reticuloceps TaxID=495285 RepID=A0A8I2YKL6_9AGAM|nr:hypothetical protein JVT61DRAFT_6023 [Boletus reticuloceps]
MFPLKQGLLSLLFISLTAVDASAVTRRNSKPTLAFAKKINHYGSLSLVERDRARVQAMKQGSQLGKRSQVDEVDAPYIAYILRRPGRGWQPCNQL